MRALLPAFCLLLLAAFASAQATNSTAAVNATGGYITPVDFFTNQTSDQWFLFYGNSTSQGSNQTLRLSNNLINDSSDNARLLSFSTTYVNYLVSDSASPFNGSFTTPNLTDFDARYNLSNLSSASNLFNETATYSLLSLTGTPAGTLSLPTVYMPGYATNGTYDAHAFSEALTQIGSAYIFVVPVSTKKGFDNRTYDFELVLPYYVGTNTTFSIFTIVAPAAASSDTGGSQTALPPVGYSWSFDGSSLVIHTEPGAAIVLHDQLGKVYNAVADSGGTIAFSLPPGQYSLRLQASNYQTTMENLYIQPATFVPPPPQATPPTSPPPGAAPAPPVTFQQTPQGTVMCIGPECYIAPSTSITSLQTLSELSCSGSICRFVGDNQSAFAQKYNFHPTGSLVVPSRLGSPAPAPDLANLLSQIGPALSEQLGGANTLQSKPMAILLIVSLVAAAMVLVLVYHPFTPKSGRRVGYD